MELTALPITEEARTLLATSIANYQRHARLRLSVDTLNGRVAWCTAHQYEPAPGGRVLTDAEIQERATQAFAPLRANDLIPIICVYTLADGDPAKPRTKHRPGKDYTLRGRIGSVLRIAPPRVLFTTDATGTHFLENEDITAGLHFDALVHKADLWANRAYYRENATNNKHMAMGEQLIEAQADVDAALRAAGVDPTQPLSGQGISVQNSGDALKDRTRTYLRNGQVLVKLRRNGLIWEVVDPK